MAITPTGKNIAFTTLIKIEGRLLEFNFRKSPVYHDTYETDVTDINGHRLMFLTVLENANWRIHGVLVPAWVEQHAPIIGEAIMQATG